MMPDYAINKWKQKGKVYFWKYEENVKNYPGWHLHADNEGCISLLNLFNLMKEMQSQAERTINITPPTSSILMIPNNKGGKAKWVTVDKVKIRSVKGVNTTDELSFIHGNSQVYLTVGESILNKLNKGIKDITEGKGDYSISHNKNVEFSRLWFW